MRICLAACCSAVVARMDVLSSGTTFVRNMGSETIAVGKTWFSILVSAFSLVGGCPTVPRFFLLARSCELMFFSCLTFGQFLSAGVVSKTAVDCVEKEW